MAYKYNSSLFLGETLGGKPSPVFFDPHTCILNNRPPTTVITGGPGSGKTYMLLNLVAQSAILGKACVFLDPKGDALGLQALSKDLGNLKFWNLAGRGQKGILDPFQMPIDHESQRLELIINTVEMFVGNITEDQRTRLGAIVEDVMREQVPSLLRVVEVMIMHRERDVRNLGNRLSLISKMKFANLCFAPGRKGFKPLSLDSGVTIVTMPGLKLTVDSKDGMSGEERISATIFFLLTSMINGMLYSSDVSMRKILVIDEAWAIAGNSAGSKVIKAVAKLGRSKNMAVILASQNQSDLMGEDIDTTISTRFAFATDYKEAANITKAMRLPTGQGFEQILTSLSPGECLMEESTSDDGRSRYSTMKAVVISPRWDEAFRTNPEDVRAREKKRRKQAAAKKNPI